MQRGVRVADARQHQGCDDQGVPYYALINKTYAEMEGHYSTTILTALPYKPRD
jgi:hypothetical protein